MMMMMMNHQLSYSSHFQLNVDCVELFCRRIIEYRCRVFITQRLLWKHWSKLKDYSPQPGKQSRKCLIISWSTCCRLDGSTLPVVTWVGVRYLLSPGFEYVTCCRLDGSTLPVDHVGGSKLPVITVKSEQTYSAKLRVNFYCCSGSSGLRCCARFKDRRRHRW